MSPLRYTVSLIDGIERNLYRLQEINIILLGERFGRNIEQFCLACQYITLDMVDCRLVKRRVEIMGHAVAFAHAVDYVHLVFIRAMRGEITIAVPSIMSDGN